MPYRFVFKVDGEEYFSAEVQSKQCRDQTKAGHQCTRTTVIGSPYCFTHLLYQHQLRIKPSTLPNAGKGLFAMTGRPGNEILYRPGQRICEYRGERLTAAQIEERYGNKTAPYAVNVVDDVHIDGALYRGVANLANSWAGHQNAHLTTTGQRAFLRATKNIRNGSEIFCSYGRGGGYQIDEPGVEYSTKYVRN